MKRLLAVIAMGVVLSVVGCTLLQTIDVDARWVPRTGSNKYWRLSVAAHAPSADPDVPHRWEINWGDGTVDVWLAGENNWPNNPDDFARVAATHEYTESGEYAVTVRCDGIMSRALSFVVGEM